jgi:hypothetical protein
MLRCPTTGRGFATGVNTDEATFRRLSDADRSIGGDHAVEGAIEGVLAGGVDCISLTVMHLIRRHQADASAVMLLIVPVEEAAAERLGILDTAEGPRMRSRELG